MNERERSEAFERAQREQRLAWLRTTPEQRIAWLEQAKRFAAEAMTAARRRRDTPKAEESSG
jgi:acyl-CoA reductase-like NAD-dependent aldehyde dehydrogenase